MGAEGTHGQALYVVIDEPYKMDAKEIRQKEFRKAVVHQETLKLERA